MQPNDDMKFEHKTDDNCNIRDIISSSSINFYKEKIFVNYSLLLLKMCLFALAIVSLVKVSYISKIRINRLREIKRSYLYEKKKFTNLSNRFDYLFSLNGEQRFMKDQHQMISRDILRVIWR
tara:strand:+ start:4025 stop:4390 length:366 start_codon:yes stop_codon:yes gene_type:complete